MKSKFIILFAWTVLAVGAGIPAWSAMHGDLRPQGSREAAADASPDGAAPLLAGDHGRLARETGRRLGRDHDEDDYDRGDDDGADDDGSRGGSAAAGPAPAGTATLPNNGLFGNGASPKVKVN
jgi:hypothetical protein